MPKNDKDTGFATFIVIIAISDIKKSKLENDVNILTPDGAWCWFADPRAVFHKGKYQVVLIGNYFLSYRFKKCCFSGINHKRTYIGWVNKHGDILIGGIDHDTQKPLKEVLIKGAIHNLQKEFWEFLVHFES